VRVKSKSKIKDKPKLSIDDPKTKKYLIVAGILLILVSFAIGFGMAYNGSDGEQSDKEQTAVGKNNGENIVLGELGDVKKATIKTSKGDILVELYPDAMPITVANFEKLVKEGFYNGLVFHRVEDWVIQGGCPNGDGTGGPGWSIELETHPELKNRRGMIAMARSSDPDSAGSQFYILKKDADWLDGKYAVFGRVVKGMDVVDRIEKDDEIYSILIDS